MKVTIEHYIATNNPNQAQAILAKYGLRAKNMSDLIRKMNKVMKVKGEEAVKEFAAIDTPYKQMLLSTIKPVEVSAPITTTTTTIEKKSSACGCSSSADGDESSNACGCSGADGEETSGCDGCGGKCGGKNKNVTSNVDGDKKTATPAPVETKSETKEATQPAKETPAPAKAEKADMMPFVIVGAVALIAVIVIAKT